MWTSEMEFDCTLITVLDDEGKKEDVTVELYDEAVDIRQFCEETGRYDLITLTHKQMLEMLEAFKHPEGTFMTKVEKS